MHWDILLLFIADGRTAAIAQVVFSLTGNRLTFHVQALVGDANLVMHGRIVMSADGWNPFPAVELV